MEVLHCARDKCKIADCWGCSRRSPPLPRHQTALHPVLYRLITDY